MFCFLFVFIDDSDGVIPNLGTANQIIQGRHLSDNVHGGSFLLATELN